MRIGHIARTAISVFIAMALYGGAASAAVIYDNNVVAINGLQSDRDPTSRFSADDFTLQPGANIITDVHWTGFYATDNSPGADSFTLQFFNNAGGVPSTSPFASYVVGGAVNRTDTGANPLGFDLYSYDAVIAPLTLAANTTFWISIFNDTTNDANDNWYWGFNSSATGNAAFRVGTVNAWQSYDGDPAMTFQLTGETLVVPEPGTLALLGLALAGLGFGRRKRITD